MKTKKVLFETEMSTVWVKNCNFADSQIIGNAIL